MIAFDFGYYLPNSAEEAVNLYAEIKTAGKKPLYYGGGTEIISMARVSEITCDAVIDIKNIPACNQVSINNQSLIIGAASTLTKLTSLNIFPLLSKSVGRIADHTIQGKITLGGNICGTIIYKESVLPFLLSDSQAAIQGIDGIRIIPFQDFFNQKPNLSEGEILMQIITDKSYIDMPFIHVKKTKQDKIDYPLLTMAALRNNEGEIRVALSGLCPFPFRSLEMEKMLNKPTLTLEEKVDKAILSIQYPILGDLLGSAEYRKFVLKNTLTNTLKQLGGK